jgi:transposase InsO family protein
LDATPSGGNSGRLRSFGAAASNLNAAPRKATLNIFFSKASDAPKNLLRMYVLAVITLLVFLLTATQPARASIGRYLDFYNRRRPHSSLDRKTPDEAYFDCLPQSAAA